MTAIAMPSFGLLVGTASDMDSGVLIDETDDGAQAARQLYPQPYHTINARWGGLSQAQHRELRAFLATNRNMDWSIEVDGETYTVRPRSNLKTVWSHGASMADCSMTLRGTLDE